MTPFRTRHLAVFMSSMIGTAMLMGIPGRPGWTVFLAGIAIGWSVRSVVQWVRPPEARR